MDIQVLTEENFAQTIAEHGGRVFRVGGCVRDQLMGVVPKDIDYCIVGMVKKNFKEIFPAAKECGKTFPVFHLGIDGVKCELAFARTERKVGPGYKGFKVSAKPKVTIQDDLFRRDTTVNSIAMDCLTGEIIDPYNGRQDIQDKVLRATSEHFIDDPMRALRLAGQSARFGFRIDHDTMPLARACGVELADEPKERMLIELTKVLAQAEKPGIFFEVLAETQLLESTFTEIATLGSSDFAMTIRSLNGVATLTNCPKVRFASLGLVLDRESISRWSNKMTLPGDWFDAAVRCNEMVALLKSPTAENIVGAITTLRRGSLTIEEFDLIIQGAALEIRPLLPFKAAMSALKVEVPKTLTGKAIGEWLRQQQVEMLSSLL